MFTGWAAAQAREIGQRVARRRKDLAMSAPDLARPGRGQGLDTDAHRAGSPAPGLTCRGLSVKSRSDSAHQCPIVTTSHHPYAHCHLGFRRTPQVSATDSREHPDLRGHQSDPAGRHGQAAAQIATPRSLASRARARSLALRSFGPGLPMRSCGEPSDDVWWVHG
jgi:hypothetical protein